MAVVEGVPQADKHAVICRPTAVDKISTDMERRAVSP